MYCPAEARASIITGTWLYSFRARPGISAGAKSKLAFPAFKNPFPGQRFLFLVMPPPRACTLQAAPDAWRETVISLAYGVLAVDDDGTNPSPGAIPTEGVDPGVLKEEGVEVWSGDDAPPVGLWSGEASGVASGEATGLGDAGTGDDDTREGVTVTAGGGIVE